MAENIAEADRKILALLQQDGRRTNQDLAEASGMSASACWRRVKALEEAGLITGYVALVSPEKAGFHFSAIVHVMLERHEREHTDMFIAATAHRPEVVECFATTGEADYHMRVVSRDKDSYNRFLNDFLFRLPGVRQVRTNVILRDIKVSTVLPLIP